MSIQKPLDVTATRATTNTLVNSLMQLLICWSPQASPLYHHTAWNNNWNCWRELCKIFPGVCRRPNKSLFLFSHAILPTQSLQAKRQAGSTMCSFCKYILPLRMKQCDKDSSCECTKCSSPLWRPLSPPRTAALAINNLSLITLTGGCVVYGGPERNSSSPWGLRHGRLPYLSLPPYPDFTSHTYTCTHSYPLPHVSINFLYIYSTKNQGHFM